ncbi:MAG: hypothetical protein JXR48_17650 [Candidatus Delongbacteria bacterium]|nr:hypothetical protein [Candidatus Delongbacteria bacterium]MBN2836783.1 hypothetical protein [Candidatus Delongbacteria bacterium]
MNPYVGVFRNESTEKVTSQWFSDRSGFYLPIGVQTKLSDKFSSNFEVAYLKTDDGLNLPWFGMKFGYHF